MSQDGAAVVLRNRCRLPLRIGRVAFPATNGELTFADAPARLEVGGTADLGGRPDSADPVDLVDRRLAITAPIPHEQVPGYIEFNIDTDRAGVCVLALDAAGVDFAVLDATAVRVHLTSVTVPQLKLPSVTLTPDHRYWEEPVTIPLVAGVTGLAVRVTPVLVAATPRPDPAPFTHDFVASVLRLTTAKLRASS